MVLKTKTQIVNLNMVSISMIHKTVNKDIHKFKFYCVSNNFVKIKRNRQLGTRLIGSGAI